jgi:uncharacterized protein (UPF0332 family)
MAERLRIAEGYRKRSREEIEAARTMLKSHFHAAAISRSYYAVFYAMNALLIEKDIVTKSHKQTAIEFRKHFIKTEFFDMKYSNILDELFNVRMLSDYDALLEIDEEKTNYLIDLAEDFVETVLG